MNKRERLNQLLNRKELPEKTKETKMIQPSTSQQEENDEQEQELNVMSTARFANEPKINFRDIEDGMERFDFNIDVHHWVNQIEENAIIFKWSELETLVYARRLINGLPKRFVTIELKPKSWVELKEGLIREYGRQKNSAKIHKLMSNTKMRQSESFTEYLYRMIELAGDQIDTSALITYVVDGIGDNFPNKLFLYNSKTIHELKDRFQDSQDLRKQKSSISPEKIQMYDQNHVALTVVIDNMSKICVQIKTKDQNVSHVIHLVIRVMIPYVHEKQVNRINVLRKNHL